MIMHNSLIINYKKTLFSSFLKLFIFDVLELKNQYLLHNLPLYCVLLDYQQVFV